MSKLFTLIAAAMMAANGLSAVRSLTPTRTRIPARHVEKMAVVTNGGASVVFIGDSITHGWEGQVTWARYFAGLPGGALNLGYGAERTEHVLWRITEGRELDGYKAKCIILMIGTNNSGHFMPDREPPIDTILGIRKVVETIRAKQPQAKLVICAILPRNNDDLAVDVDRRNRIVNHEIMKFADGKDIFWCDFGEQLRAPDGTIPRTIMPDQLHPSNYGYEVWAAAVKPYVDFAMADGRLPAPPNRYAPFVRVEDFGGTESLAIIPCSRFRNERLDKWWADRIYNQRMWIDAATNGFDIVMLGDSITDNWSSIGKDSLAEFRKHYSVLNLGISGDRTEHLLWRLRNGQLDGYLAKWFMLMIGTNNTWTRMERAEDTAHGIRLILAEIAKHQPQAKTLLLPIFPRGESAQNKHRVRNEEVNAIIRRYVDNQKVFWLDFNAKFLDASGKMNCSSGDLLHPNAAAYREIWLPSVLPWFKQHLR